ncbi:AEC family transporter [Bengtsoniella intestinalis]|uniref:AEC family transporter n=1 Tax=Bengtsoniella intestinalis TaxID=3073143 RepID=UPI00391FBA24
MGELSQVFTVQGILFALMFIGFLLRKRHVVEAGFQKGLTALVINVVLPCNIITAFYVEFSMDTLVQSAQIFVVSLLVQLGCFLLALALYGRQSPQRRAVLQYGVICSNAGLLGNPVAQGLFGAQGLLLASIYLIPMRTAMWSLGVAMFAAPSKEKWWVKVLRHPCIIAVEIGMVLLVTQWKLPNVVVTLVGELGDCTMALSMVLIGILLSDFQWKDFLNPQILRFCVVRLVAIPLAVYLGCLVANIDDLPMYVAVIMAAMPAGATTAIIASSEGGDVDFAVGCVTVSTLLSMIAIPIWCMVIG